MLQKVDTGTLKESNLLTNFFDGECRGTGVVIDRLGRVRDRISLAMTGRWENGIFTMDETFVHEDGRVEAREWKVVTNENNPLVFTAACPEMRVPAKGRATQNSVVMNYTYPVSISGRQFSLQFDDRMYLTSETTIFERAIMKKFGFNLADIYINFEKIG